MASEISVLAADARYSAYAPYSNFEVGCVVTWAEFDGTRQYTVGVNVENASYGLTICAERSAIFSAVASGMEVIREIYCATKDGKGTSCGACRQVIREFADENTMIHFVDEWGEIVSTYTIDELLPDSFGPERLENA